MSPAKLIYFAVKKKQLNRWVKEQNKSVADLKNNKECVV
jgi:hypothetical protein